jgi:hypothetical protein
MGRFNLKAHAFLIENNSVEFEQEFLSVLWLHGDGEHAPKRIGPIEMDSEQVSGKNCLHCQLGAPIPGKAGTTLLSPLGAAWLLAGMRAVAQSR